MQSQISIFRIRLFVLFFAVFFILIIFKLYDLQVNKFDSYKEISNKQYVEFSPDYTDRAAIILRYKDGKEFFAAIDKSNYNIFIDPRVIKNPEDVFNILSAEISLNAEDFFVKTTKKNDSSELIANNVSKEITEKIMKLRLQGISNDEKKFRFYPGKELAAHIIGFLSYKGDNLTGTYGLERQFNDLLIKEKNVLFKNFFVQLFAGPNEKKNTKENLESIVLTIEPNVQTFAEETISKINKQWNPKKVGIIIMNPENGEIYAMALSPTFDLNNFGKEENVSIFNNDIVESIYQMGSIIKPLTIAIGIEENKISPNSTYNDLGSMTLNGETFYNHDKKPHGVVNMQEVLNKSLNLGAAHVALLVGESKFRDYIKKIFDQKTEIDLPNEVGSKIDNLDSLQSIEIASASFGQGIAVSPIQTIRALNTLANGGYLIYPHVVKSIKYSLNKEEEIKPKEKIKIFNGETTAQVSSMLVKAVDEALLGGKISMKNYSIAAKTGTAQVVENGKYSEDKYFHSFIGYFPAFDPKFIILLYAVEPRGVLYSADSLTLPFSEIVKYLINYYQIEPDR